MRYADYAVGQFIEDAKKLSYFKDTLFVFVGDHGFHVAPKLTEVHLLFHHVPLLFYAPGLTDRKGVDHRVATQMNIQPSVLGLLGMNDAQRSPWGRSLFNDSWGDDGFAVFKMSTGGPAVALARGDKVLVLGSATGKPQLSRYSLAFPPSLEPLSDPTLEKQMERELRAYVGCGLNDLTNRHAGPVKNDPD
jgi:phosphoglycerol transferase MdoB-like AlkP superfamily enzyme